MLADKKEFLAGFLMAAMAVVAIFEPLVIQASAKMTPGPEVAFSRQLGLFGQQEFSNRALNSPISEAAFQSSLARVLAETGLLGSHNRSELVRNGIIDGDKPGRTITRQAACEGILRSIMFSWIRNCLPRPEEPKSEARFRDWQPDAKYAPALDYAMHRGIIQGGPDGSFRPGARLKLKEALWLLKRLYELILNNGNTQKFGLFADVPQDHYMTRPLLNLRSAGAFDRTNLGRHLNGTGNIKIRDLGRVIQGILVRLNQQEQVAKIDRIMKNHSQNLAATRNLLARMAAVLTSAIPHEELNQHILYSDVRPDTEVSAALKTLARVGIRLGYNNNLFAGNEYVSRFEALGVINRIISELEPAPEKESSELSQATRTATSADMAAFINRLRSKRERVRRILSRT